MAKSALFTVHKTSPAHSVGLNLLFGPETWPVSRLFTLSGRDYVVP